MIIYYCVYLIEFNPYLVKKVNLLDSHGINFFMNTTLLLQVLSELHFLAKNQPEIVRIQQFGFLRQISQLQTILIIINFFRRTPLRLNEILQVWHYLILIPPLFSQNSAGGGSYTAERCTIYHISRRNAPKYTGRKVNTHSAPVSNNLRLIFL